MTLQTKKQKKEKQANRPAADESRLSGVFQLLCLLALLVLGVSSVLGDAFPPYWQQDPPYTPQVPNPIHFQPAPWPLDSEWVAVTANGVGIKDKRNQDPSNGGTSPQNYANVSSGCTDQTLPSIYWSYDVDTNVLFFRWRVAQRANTYCVSGNNPSNFSSSDPWNSALYTVLIDVTGDGFRNYAMHLDGSSGSPAEAIDMLRGIYSDRKDQILDYTTYADIYLTGHNPSAFVDRSSGKNQFLMDFQNTFSPIPFASPPTCGSRTNWDYGTTRSVLAENNACGEYFVDYQIPFGMLAYGGAPLSGNQPISLSFTTGNSLNDPYQKDFVWDGGFTMTDTKCFPGSDYIIPAQGTTVLQPIVSGVTASDCSPVNLSAIVQDQIGLSGGACEQSVVSVDFYYYYDANSNGFPDDNSTWTFMASAAVSTAPTWTATWDGTTALNGDYLVGLKATDSSGNITWSMLTAEQVNALMGTTPPNYANPSPITGVIYTTVTIDCGVNTYLSGFVYNDANRDMVKNDSENGTGETLYVKACQAGSVIAVASVNPATGFYEMPGLLNGTYTFITATDDLLNCTPADPAGWISTTPNSFTMDFNTTRLENVNFGKYRGARVSGKVFEDKGDGSTASANANNAIYNLADEYGIANVIVRACTDVACSTVIDSTITDGKGDYTLWIDNAYNGSSIHIVKTELSGWLATGNSIGNVVNANSSATSQARSTISFAVASGTLYDDHNFGGVRTITIAPPQSYLVGQGSSLTIPHTINLFTPGVVALSLASQEMWGYVVYEDLDCDLNPDGGPLAPSGGYYTLNSGNALGAGAACIILRVMVPASVPPGKVENLAIMAVEDWLNTAGNNGDTGNIYDDSAMVSDVITVGPGGTGQIRLLKYVRNVTLGEGFSFGNQASPCDYLEYKINFKNIGATKQKDLVISDNIPNATAFAQNRYSGNTRDVSVTVENATYLGNVDDEPDIDGIVIFDNALSVNLDAVSGGLYKVLEPGQSGYILYQVRLLGNCP